MSLEGSQEAGARLRRLRTERGLSLNELSRATHYSKGYLSRIESGEKTLTPGVAHRCDQVLETGGELAGLVERSAGACPYRGLSAYEPHDARWFFGRERALRALVARLAEPRRGPLVVVAPSGAGKSSLLRAGLVPAVQRGALPAAGSRGWPVVLITPGKAPVEALAAGFGTALGGDAAGLAATLMRDPGAFAAQVGAAVKGRAVLIVDQLEEAFTLCADQAQRRAFLVGVHALASRPLPGQADEDTASLVVLGLRADFYSHCLAHPELVEALHDGHVPLGPMTPDELAEVITGPARESGLTLEPGLIELLLRDMGAPPREPGPAPQLGRAHEPGALPLLSHALLSTWKQRRGNVLTVAGYRAVGGIAGAVARTAERVYATLGPGHQDLARRLLSHLVCVSDDGTETRRPVDVRQLPEAHFPTPATTEVIEAFARARLLIVGSDSVRLAHEALLWAWPRLRDWIDADRAGLRTRRQLASAAHSWEHDGLDPSLLYRGSRLRTARQWAAANAAMLTAAEQRFLDAGAEAEAEERAALNRRASRRRRLVAGGSALLAVTLAAALLAVGTLRSADEQAAQSLSRHLATQSESLLATDSTTAQLLAVAAYRIAPTADARRSMLSALAHPAREVLTGHVGGVSGVAFSQGGPVLASGGLDGTVRLWNLTTRSQASQPLTGHTGSVMAVAFAPGDRLLASADNAGTVRLWDVPSGYPRGTFALRTGPVTAIRFGPGGRTLATGEESGVVRLWDIQTARPLGVRTGHRGAVTTLQYSPDGRTLASADEHGTVLLWDVQAKQPREHPLATHSHGVYGMAFSPDGRTLATAADDTMVRLWDVATGQLTGRPLVGRPGHRIRAVAFSPDGRTVAAGGREGGGVLLAWDIATRRPAGAALTGHTGWITDIQFGSDGRTLASTSSDDSTVRLWDMVTYRPIGTPLRQAGSAEAVAFSPDGQLLAGTASGETATVRLWDSRTLHPIGAPLAGHTGSLDELEFAPDGRTLISADGDGAVLLWETLTHHQEPPLGEAPFKEAFTATQVAISPDGKLLATGDTGTITGVTTRSTDDNVLIWDLASRRPTGPPLLDHTEGMADLEFSPDGRTLAVVSNREAPQPGLGARHEILLYDVASRRPTGPPLAGHSDDVNDVEYSPDGRLLASTGRDRTVRLWDVATRRPAGGPLTGHLDEVTDVEFSPDGRFLASAGFDETIQLWDVATRRPIGVPLNGHVGAVRAVAFRPDSRVLASAGEDGTVQLWDVALPGDPARTLCAIASRSRPASTPGLSRAEWAQYAPGLRYLQVCPSPQP
ncbi:helix-turn-helix domain-containing protein [Nonomuraea sp. NPDC049152]|uniref:nSTAND1 domain-containing NTPase n=1 Tax=Nonomuraea sp. NPDC049152 TaxID=3154350 RepID=UPI0033D8F2AB